MKFRTIQGREITGDIINRYTRIMSVAGHDGRNYVCWLVGDPRPLEDFSFTPVKPENFRGIEPKKCRVIKPDGTCITFVSMGAAGIIIGLIEVRFPEIVKVISRFEADG